MRQRFVRALFSLSFLVGLGGCATNFTGDAHFPGGARGCFDKCAKDGMVMSGFVYAGEYSSACVCQPKMSGPAAANQSTPAAVAAAVGVVTQARAEQQRQQMTMHH